MKIYEHIDIENGVICKFLGISIFEQTTDYETGIKFQKFLGSTLTTVKISDTINCNYEKTIKLFEKPILKHVEQDNNRIFYLFNKKIRQVSLLKIFKKKYFKYFDTKYDDIYILYSNGGEAYLTLTYLIDTLIKKNGSKHPLLALTRKYHIDMVKMICPDIPYVYIKDIHLNIQPAYFAIDNFRFFMLYTNSHFKRVELDIKADTTGEVHYFNIILNSLNLSKEDIQIRKIHLSEEYNSAMLKKVLPTGLNFNNFVLIAPEAKSCKLYDENFWCELINRLQEKGYDVFVNLIKDNIKLMEAKDFKTCKLTFGEAFALAKRAKKIVSLRSGFTEFLLQTGVPMDVLYTKFRRRNLFNDMDIYHVMSGFGLSNIPYLDKTKIREFNMLETDKKEVINDIINNIPQ